MAKTIVILGTLDTKGEQLTLLKRKIEARGHTALIMDLSMGAVPSVQADVPASEIARLAGKQISELVKSRDRSSLTEVMTSGAQQKVPDLLSKGEIDGIIALGGAEHGADRLEGYGEASLWPAKGDCHACCHANLHLRMVRRHGRRGDATYHGVCRHE